MPPSKCVRLISGGSRAAAETATIRVEEKPVAPAAVVAPKQAGSLDAATEAQVRAIIGDSMTNALAWFVRNKHITDEQSIQHIKPELAAKIIASPAQFLRAVNIQRA